MSGIKDGEAIFQETFHPANKRWMIFGAWSFLTLLLVAVSYYGIVSPARRHVTAESTFFVASFLILAFIYVFVRSRKFKTAVTPKGVAIQSFGKRLFFPASRIQSCEIVSLVPGQKPTAKRADGRLVRVWNPYGYTLAELAGNDLVILDFTDGRKPVTIPSLEPGKLRDAIITAIKGTSPETSPEKGWHGKTAKTHVLEKSLRD